MNGRTEIAKMPHLAKRFLLTNTASFCMILCLISLLPETECTKPYSRLPSAEFGCDLSPLFAHGSHGVPARSGDNGFGVKLEGLPQNYQPDKTYTVTLRSTHPATFRGFALTAVHEDGSRPAGNFAILNPWATKNMPLCNHTVTHSASGKKGSVQFVWTSPSSGFGCVRIRASVVQKGTIWFRDDGDLSLSICESTEDLTTHQSPECCSCGSAQYRMTFYGLWSPQTHPKDYPAYSTHWSNVIGASHSDQYSVWDYGEYASDGVKKVAEWGWPNALEDEIRGQGESVLSVIKTRAQWPAYQPRNIREPPSSVFNVDSNRHLVSLVTMLGPSPDWNVGIAKETMCTSECGWENLKSFDLTPWDAGTDSGVSYLSPNSPTDPPDKIRALTTRDDPESPFYNPDGGAIPPVARVVLERISITGEQCGTGPGSSSPEEPPVEPDVVEPPISSCVYGDWSEWTSCEVTCGWGIKVRSKSLKIKLVPSASCEQSIMEKEICKGAEQCEGEDLNTVCLYSDWSEWSECTSPCGKDALRFRTRQLRWPSEPRNCDEPLKEMKFDCNTVPCEEKDILQSGCSYHDWSDWMPCSAQCGVGKTLRKRFPIDGEDCESPQMELSKCMASADCQPPVGFDVSTGCNYSPWTGWMPCPVTCGAGDTFRKRVLDSSAPNVHCDEVQMERTKCMTSEFCPENAEPSCEYGNWTEWMPCSQSCGVGETLRKRFLKGGGTACDGFQMETVRCYMPPCHLMTGREEERRINLTRQTCIYGEWTAWMPCSVTCGGGETLRKRFLTKSLDISSTCEGFEMEINQCTIQTSCEIGQDEAAEISEHTGQWTECSATCGYGERSRKLTRTDCAADSGEDCSEIEYEECSVPLKCPIDCVLSEWSNWSSCYPCKQVSRSSRTRQKKAFQIRTRTREVRRKFGGVRCGPRKEKRKCVCR